MNRHRTRLLMVTAATATVSALVLAAALIVVPALATPQTGVTPEQVAKGSFGEINVKTHNFPPHKVKLKTKGDSDVYVIRNTFAAGGSSGWHTHPGPSLITVTKGEITPMRATTPPARPRSTGRARGSSILATGACICCATRPPRRRRRWLSRSFRKAQTEGLTPLTRATARSQPRH